MSKIKVDQKKIWAQKYLGATEILGLKKNLKRILGSNFFLYLKFFLNDTNCWSKKILSIEILNLKKNLFLKKTMCPIKALVKKILAKRIMVQKILVHKNLDPKILGPKSLVKNGSITPEILLIWSKDPTFKVW